MASNNIRVLVVRCGNMGKSHAKAYHNIDGFEICGIVSRGKSKEILNKELGGGYPLFDDYVTALEQTKPEAVAISTWPDTHEAMAVSRFCELFIRNMA